MSSTSGSYDKMDSWDIDIRMTELTGITSAYQGIRDNYVGKKTNMIDELKRTIDHRYVMNIHVIYELAGILHDRAVKEKNEAALSSRAEVLGLTGGLVRWASTVSGAAKHDDDIAADSPLPSHLKWLPLYLIMFKGEGGIWELYPGIMSYEDLLVCGFTYSLITGNIEMSKLIYDISVAAAQEGRCLAKRNMMKESICGCQGVVAVSKLVDHFDDIVVKCAEHNQVESLRWLCRDSLEISDQYKPSRLILYRSLQRAPSSIVSSFIRDLFNELYQEGGDQLNPNGSAPGSTNTLCCFP